MREFDVVVAGGGSAGCVVASRLSENPDCSVCLVEAGPDYGPHEAGGWPADILNACELAFSHSWERDDSDDRSQLRARILGGCSAHNACAMLPAASSDYDEWGTDWTAAELDPYLARAVEAMRTRRFSGDELAPLSRAVLASAGALELPRLEDASEDRAGAGPFPVNAVGTIRWNAAFAYLDPARERPNLTIVGDTLVDRVRLDDLRGLVLADGNEIRARTVVVSAGAYGSPAILLRSGITDLPVGENLIDHPGTGAGWAPAAALRDETGRYAERHSLFTAQVVVKAQSDACERESWDIHLFPATDTVKDELGHPTGSYELSAALFAMKPHSRGRVTLNGPDPRTPPHVEHGFLSDERDAVVLVEALEQLRRLMGHEELDRYTEDELRPGVGADLDEYVRETVRGYFHPAGTCALGSVVGAGGEVIGYDGLFVADASVMPTAVRANTNLSTLAVAEKIAAGLAAG